MSTFTLTLSRDWWRIFQPLILVLSLALLQARHPWEDPLNTTLFILCALLAVAAVIAGWRPVVLDISWSADQFAVHRKGRQVFACSWHDEVVVTEDQRHFQIYAPGKWRPFSLPKVGLPAQLQAVLTARLQMPTD